MLFHLLHLNHCLPGIIFYREFEVGIVFCLFFSFHMDFQLCLHYYITKVFVLNQVHIYVQMCFWALCSALLVYYVAWHEYYTILISSRECSLHVLPQSALVILFPLHFHAHFSIKACQFPQEKLLQLWFRLHWIYR